jgi:hypothetical protein
MNLILSHEFVTVNGKSIPKVYGGFGAGQASILAKQVAEIHGRELFKINQLINNNRDWYEEGIDIINLAILSEYSQKHRSFLLNFYTQDALNASKSIYLLSQQGYALLCRDLKSDLAKQIYKQVVRDYFKMAETQQDEVKAKKVLKKREEKSSKSSLLSGKLAEFIVEELQQNREELNQVYLELREQKEEIRDLKEEVKALKKLSTEKPELSTIRNSSPLPKWKSSSAKLKEVERESSIQKKQGEMLRQLVNEKAKTVKERNRIWFEFKKHFDVTRYIHLPKARFEEALKWLRTL